MGNINTKISCAQTTLADLIKSYGCSQPQKTAFIEDGRQLNWGRFDSAVDAVAGELALREVGDGDRIGLLAANSAWAYCVMFGIVRAGAVSTALSTMLSDEVLINLIDDAGITILYVGKGFDEMAAKAVSSRPHLQLIAESDVFTNSDEPRAKTTYLPVKLDRPYSITYSSGTTGTPKGIVHSHFARLWFAYEIGNHFDFCTDSICVITTPPYSNGTNICLLPAIHRGGTMILMPKFDADEFCRLTKEYRPSHTFMVPTQFQALLNSKQSAVTDWSCFTALVTAGAPMSQTTRRALLELLGPRLAELWGLTEGVGCSLRTAEMQDHAGAVGRIAPGSDIRLIDPQGNEVEEGVGEIVGRSPMLMDGYFNLPEATANVLWDSPEGLTYLRTGDVGEFDEHGYLWIRGRIKDMIISGGFNIYPIDIEEVLSRTPGIIEAAVIGMGDEHWGEVPVAICVVPKGASADEADILKEVNRRLTKIQRLKKVIIQHVPLPRNALGKVLKHELKNALLKVGEV